MTPETNELLVKLLNHLKPNPTSNAELMKALGIGRGKLRNLVTKLKKIGYVGTSYGGVYLLKFEYDVWSMLDSLELPSRVGKVKLARCTICHEMKQKERKVLTDGKVVHVIPNTMIEWSDKVPIDSGYVKGMVCPDCIALEDLMDEPSKVSDRKCAGCGNNLPKARYFQCYDCKPEMIPKVAGIEVDEDFLYEDGDTNLDEDFFETLESLVGDVNENDKGQEAAQRSDSTHTGTSD
jgi:biotin operon repressor